MAVAGISWSQGDDYHLVPGLTSPRLNQLLWIDVDPGGQVRADSQLTGVAVSFAADFVAGAPRTGGVVVNPSTGEVSVGALPAAPRLLDFLVVATVTEGGNTFTAYIRFHIHERITKMWLTPAELTVRVGASNVRFSTIAEFKDGTYGDVSNWSPWEFDPQWGDLTFVHQTGAAQPVVSWATSAVGDMDIDSKTGVLDCSVSAANATITAATPLPAGIASGRAVGGQGWIMPLTLQPLEGASFATMDAKPNILILGDGFRAAERQDFLELAGLAVKELHTGARTSPFNLLKDGMNYFAAFVPSRQSGISNLSPMDRTPLSGTQGEARAVDVAVPPGSVPGSVANIGHPSTPATNTRFILNELDTAFGAVLGERPRAERIQEFRSAYPSERRFSEDDFDAFLGALRDPAGNPVGHHWQRRDANHPERGKDETSIVVLCRSNYIGGQNNPRDPSGNLICLTLDLAEKQNIDLAAGGMGQDLMADPIPTRTIRIGGATVVQKRVSIDMRNTVAHELGHSFTLGDEYGGGGPLPTDQLTLDATRGYANVQARVDVLDLATQSTLDVTRIKWGLWPRIVRAGVLGQAPIPQGGPIHRLRLEAPQAAQFQKDAIVRLRTRPLPTSEESYRLRVKSVVGDSELEVENAELPYGAPLDTGYPAGSIVMEPKRAPNQGSALGDDLSLVHWDVLVFMDSQRNPLNAAHGSPNDRSCPGPERAYDWSTPALNYGPGNAPDPPRESGWITGLWEKGMTFDCDVYHPTGACLMNVSEFETGKAFQFCWICRYAMVDFVDPTLHGQVDANCAERYPT